MFERSGNRMEPTAAARQILPIIRQSLELIASAFPPPASAREQVLRLGVLPSFAAKWLVPRLGDFHDANPGISIALDARLEVSTLGDGGLDAAIRYGAGDWPGMAATRLLADTLFPACAPAYRRRLGIQSVQDFSRCRLLRNSWVRWTPWLQAAGIVMPEPSDSVPYDDAGLMLDAVIAGQGIGLVRRVIAHDALASGHLVRLSDVEVPFAGAYYFVVPQNAKANSGGLDTFRAWLTERLMDDFTVPTT
jgi:LysR family glycine cleavage system transcriptional activator